MNSNSLQIHSEEIHIVVGIVSFKTLYGRIRKGVCSNYLATLKEQSHVDIYISEGFVKLPKTNVLPPLIFVGPGTGCAIFRSFLEEIDYNRREMETKTTDIAFFFGNRHKGEDFLFEFDWKRFLDNGTLTLFEAAFSRDQPNKMYVFHKIEKHREKLKEMIDRGAMIVVSGNAQQMPKDVRTTFEEIAGKDVIAHMFKKGLYKEDVWF